MTDPIGAIHDLAEQQREQDTVNVYRDTLNAAEWQAPEVRGAYDHLMVRRTAEMLARRYPGAPAPSSCYRRLRMVRCRLISAVVEAEECSTFVNSLNPVAEIIRAAQLRGWQSRAQIEAVRAAQVGAPEPRARDYDGENVRAGDKLVEIGKVWITDAGRAAPEAEG